MAARGPASGRKEPALGAAYERPAGSTEARSRGQKTPCAGGRKALSQYLTGLRWNSGDRAERRPRPSGFAEGTERKEPQSGEDSSRGNDGGYLESRTQSSS